MMWTARPHSGFELDTGAIKLIVTDQRDRDCGWVWHAVADHAYGSDALSQCGGFDTSDAAKQAACDWTRAFCDKTLAGISDQRPAIAVLVKRPVAFRVQRANDDGLTLSKTEWRYFSDEAEAARESDALCADCQALFVRDGTAIIAEWEGIETAPKDGSSFLGVWYSDISVGRAPEPHISISSWAGGWTPYDRKLTHWMSLPAPPPLSVGKAIL